MKRGLKDFTRKKQMYGRMFILPWEIGFVLFFLQPLVQSLVFVFSKVNVDFEAGVFLTEWNGIENIKHYLYVDTKYMDYLVESIGSFVLNIPLIGSELDRGCAAQPKVQGPRDVPFHFLPARYHRYRRGYDLSGRRRHRRGYA